MEEIGDVEGKDVTFCKRVKYLDQAWFLVSKSAHYYWVNQSSIPLDKIKAIDAKDIEQETETLMAKL